MEASRAMEVAEALSIELQELHDKLEEAKKLFEDVWATIDMHDNYTREHETKFKQGSWDLSCAMDALRQAADLMDEAYDLLDEG